MTISKWLSLMQDRYGQSPFFSKLDLELILCYCLGEGGASKDRSFLAAHPEIEINFDQGMAAEIAVHKRFSEGEPLAYILGKKEFYGRDFCVDNRVLIPRPETETLINAVKKIVGEKQDQFLLVDVGTGSACIAATVKLELPKVQVVGVDISEWALTVAKENVDKLGAEVELLQSDLLEKVDFSAYDKESLIIVANLPYVDKNWDWISRELAFEPETALYARDGGLAEIKRFLQQVEEKVSDKCCNFDNIYVILELDSSQKDPLLKYIEKTFSGNQRIKLKQNKKILAQGEDNFALVFEVCKAIA
ncbi:peptide chain release factor N(5)-glutamine methyltransferase [Candidatus Saccharibacteria bacterium]|nr:peptide chain release factor N(5)-glutamine methyltransferase [Candidatus Saccharibacteria bacterium]